MASLVLPALLFVHLLAAVLWIGGMIFVHFALRPALAEVLAPPAPVQVMVATLARFFRLVAVAVVALLASGAALLLRVGVAAAPAGWLAMALLGLVMALVFAYIHAVLFARLRALAAAGAWPAAAAVLGRIRALVGFNLLIGVAVLASAALSRG